MSEQVHEVTINFHNKTKVSFFGSITTVEMEKGNVVYLKWKNAIHD